MPTEIIINGIEKGDKARAAKIIGCARSFITQVVSGEKDDTLNVEATLKQIVADRVELRKKFSKKQTPMNTEKDVS